MRNDPALAAVTEIRPGRYPELDELALHSAVISAFLDQWDVRPGDIDGVLAAPTGVLTEGGADVAVHEKVADELGIRPRFSQTMYAGGAGYALMVARAAEAIAAGRADAVLCISAGKFPKVGAASGEKIAKFVSHPEFEYPYGTYIPVLYALFAQRWMAETGATGEDLAAVAVAQRQWALLHPDAFMRDKGPLTVADVLGSRMIASPFHLYDCSVPLEGGAALLVTSGERARAVNERPAYLLGYGEVHMEGAVSMRSTFDTGGATDAAGQAFAMSGLAPSEIDVAQLYDSFSANPLMYLEECGLAGRGKAPELYRSGATAPGGSLPVNTYGGLMSFGHTGDASGMSMVVEGRAAGDGARRGAPGSGGVHGTGAHPRRDARRARHADPRRPGGVLMAPAKPAPEPTALSAPYWAAAARGQLSAPWCEPCADWVFPPRPRCPRCGGSEMGWRPPATTGEVVTFSVVHQAAYEAYRDDQPYVVAIVALDGGPQLMTNLVDGPDPGAVTVGQRVELTFEARGESMQVPQFRPVS